MKFDIESELDLFISRLKDCKKVTLFVDAKEVAKFEHAYKFALLVQESPLTLV